MGDALQFKFNVALLKMTALDPNPVPFAEGRTLTGPKRRMEFWATIEGTAKAQHATITPKRRMDTFLILGNSLTHPASKATAAKRQDLQPLAKR
jgi:hypothetical protein